MDGRCPIHKNSPRVCNVLESSRKRLPTSSLLIATIFVVQAGCGSMNQDEKSQPTKIYDGRYLYFTRCDRND